MKRTTYIMIGMLLAGFAVISGIMFYSISHGTTREDLSMEIGGEQKTVQLPVCKVVKLTQPSIVWRQKSEGIREADRILSFEKTPLAVSPTDSLQGSLSLASDMASFVSITSVGDTAFITFDIPKEKIAERFQDVHWLEIKSEEMRLNIPATVQAVLVNTEGMKTTFSNFRCDTLSFQSSGTVRVENSHITALTAQAHLLNFISGEVRDLYLNLDGITDWTVNTSAHYDVFFQIDTEHLTGSGNHRCELQKGEARQVLWTPKNDKASLDVNLEQAARIDLSE